MMLASAAVEDALVIVKARVFVSPSTQTVNGVPTPKSVVTISENV